MSTSSITRASGNPPAIARLQKPSTNAVSAPSLESRFREPGRELGDLGFGHGPIISRRKAGQANARSAEHLPNTTREDRRASWRLLAI